MNSDMNPWLLMQHGQDEQREGWLRQGHSLVADGKLSELHFECIIRPSLERFQYWLLNIPVPNSGSEVPAISLCHQGWMSACQQWERGLGLEAGLSQWLDTLFQGLLRWQILPSAAAGREEAWKGFSVGLTRWAECRGLREVWINPVNPSQGGWCTLAHWAGRVLPGEGWACLEQCCWPVPSFSTEPTESESPYQGLVQQLLIDGRWDPNRKPGKLWRDERGWWWLWPLALRDLSNLIAIRQQAKGPEQLQDWQRLELIEASAQIERCFHPLLGRRVDGVRPAAPVQQWLTRWYGMLP